MPANLVHCQTCRTLLNDDLEADSIEIPEFIPLAEIEAMVEAEVRGLFIACPHCDHELRINKKYKGLDVSCKFCHQNFRFDTEKQNLLLLAFYSSCPHCNYELRAALKYLGKKVLCKKCEGQIEIKPDI